MSSKWEVACIRHRRGWEEIQARLPWPIYFPDEERMLTSSPKVWLLITCYGRKLSPVLVSSLFGTKCPSPLPPPQSCASLQSVGESRAESVFTSICWVAQVMCHRWERTTGMLVGRLYLISCLLLRSFSKVKLPTALGTVDTILYLMFVVSISLVCGMYSLYPSRTHELHLYFM